MRFDMKKMAAIFLVAWAMNSSLASASTMAPAPGANYQRAEASVSIRTGRVDSVSASTGEIVIGGMAYAYNPNTIFRINGQQCTATAIRKGDVVQFRPTRKRGDTSDALIFLNVQR